MGAVVAMIVVAVGLAMLNRADRDQRHLTDASAEALRKIKT